MGGKGANCEAWSVKHGAMKNVKSQVLGHKTWVEVNSRAILHNLHVVRRRVGKDVAVLAVVKSNAYGHGLLEVAKGLCAHQSFSKGGWFGVDNIDEALTLKKAGIKNPIIILGYIPRPRLAEGITNGFRFVLYDTDVLTECAHIAKRLKKKALVHLKVETGTYRQGIVQADIPRFAELLRGLQHVVIPEGVYTHFADTENTSSMYYKEQLRRFKESITFFEELGIMPKYRHVAASAAALLYPKTHYNMVRWGIGLYGLYPSKDVQSSALRKMKLAPALTWKTRIAQIKAIPKNSTIGYDRAFTASQPMKIAVLPVGYWDGYDRHLSNKGIVLVRGKKCPVAGNICMNMCMVDVTTVPGARAGDEVVLLGKQGSREITAEDVAEKIGTINYEVITRINPLVSRIVT